MQAIAEKLFERLLNITATDREWSRRVVVRERQLKKELKCLKDDYLPELRKVKGDEHKALWAEYSAQCKDIEDELLSIAVRRFAIDVPDHWDDFDGNGCFFQTKETKAMNAMKRAIRDEQLKGLGLTVAILGLAVAFLALLVGWAGVWFS